LAWDSTDSWLSSTPTLSSARVLPFTYDKAEESKGPEEGKGSEEERRQKG
jgi:hypothetical protein